MSFWRCCASPFAKWMKPPVPDEYEPDPCLPAPENPAQSKPTTAAPAEEPVPAPVAPTIRTIVPGSNSSPRHTDPPPDHAEPVDWTAGSEPHNPVSQVVAAGKMHPAVRATEEDPFLAYVKLKKYMVEREVVRKEDLRQCFTQAEVLRALHSMGSYVLSNPQLKQLELVEQRERKSGRPVCDVVQTVLNAEWNLLRSSQLSHQVFSLDWNTPKKKEKDCVRFVCIGNTHGKHDQIMHLPEGDILLHCGGFSTHGEPEDVLAFSNWIASQPFSTRIVIAGPQELSFDAQTKETIESLLHGCTYLQDEPVTVLGGLTVYGSPWTPTFGR
eukprot:TRINITY_DN975_c0_g1_i3.p1 TRINITY_DN975_c0_g1~~TRINITY_DN975_c0_g1_i3.p1  ORF type:complete len:327 (-),score=67.24 TRINITY_DN975_c0_g1_i3:540-1520(-)